MLDRNAYVHGFFLLNDLQAQENNLKPICGSHEALISNDIMLQHNAIQHLVLREGIFCVFVCVWLGVVVWDPHLHGIGSKLHKTKLLGFPAVDYGENL